MGLTTTARTIPTGRRLSDGYQSYIAFSQNAAVKLWEKAVKPPGIDGGPPIDTTTMWNAAWRTAASKSLKTLTGGTVKCAYATAVYSDIIAMINVEGAITIHYSDGATLDFFGYLQKFEEDDLVEGTQPTATATFVCTNTDPVLLTEVAPVYTAATGTPH